MAACDAVSRAIRAVFVFGTALRARAPVALGCALDRFVAAMPEARSLELPADLDRSGVQVCVLPAEADRLGLADAD